MGMSLQSELEPLLTKLWEVADSKYWDDALLDPTNEAYVQQAREGLQYFNQNLSSLITRFREYYSLDGHDIDSLVDRVASESDRWESPTGNSTYSLIARAAGEVDEVEKLIHLGHWQGGGADSFYHNFLDPFKNTAITHCGCSREMAIGAKSLAGGVERAKESVVWICKDLISRLGGGGSPGPLPGEKEEGFKEHAGFVAILADAVALFRALTAPESAALDIALAALGTGGGLIAESKTPGHEQHISVDPSVSASSSVMNAGLSLDRLNMNIEELDETIGRGLDRGLSSAGPFGSTFASIKNPHLQPSAYRQLKGRGLGNPAEEKEDIVVVDVVQLYYAGFRALPAAAQEYDSAARICSDAHIDGVQNQFPNAVRTFNEAAETFHELLTSVRDEIAESGTAIVSAATTYGSADQYESEQIRNLENDIPSPGSFTGADHYTPPEWLIP
ncbi:hypothetical protein ACIBCN_06195 [Nocardia sp. NPDC051052]|uniref:hypothetical protein n=1 Tax=Nocardia sp. NPDC051052 TaxID=3364322 RepID=UPI0037A818C1